MTRGGIARQIARYLRPYRWPFLGALAQLLLISALELAKPWPLKIVIDGVLTGKLGTGVVSAWAPETVLFVACALLVVIHVILGGVSLAHLRTGVRIGQRMVHGLQSDLYAHLQRLSLAFHTRRQIGDLMYRLTADTYAVQTLTTNAIFPVVSALLLLCGMFVVLARTDWLLTLLALSVCPALIIVLATLNRRIATAAADSRERESGVYTLAQQALSSIRVVQAFTREGDEHRRFMTASHQSLAANLRLYTLQTVYSWMVNVVLALGTALVVWTGARYVLAGTVTVGELVVFTSYLAALYVPINNILDTYANLHAARAGARRVFDILDIEHDLPDGRETFPAQGAAGAIAWEHVSFDYLSGQSVLQDVDLRVEPGQKVAIVGPTGAGKSTLVSLVARFYDARAGRVLVDGRDVREFQLASLRRQISMVLQPPLVFPTTLRDNIAYGRPEAAFDEVVRAATLAAAHDFIIALPHGYDTIVGESGATLSEGEKLRVTIARAILRDAPILILDEPTASLDAHTEAVVMQAIGQLTANRTCLIIAHRLSTILSADRIVVLRGGRIAEHGTFAELMDRGGHFAALYRAHVAREGTTHVLP